VDDDLKKPAPLSADRFQRALRADEDAGRVWRPKILTPEEVERQMMEHMECILKAKREQIEREQRAVEEFERELESALANAEADPPADIVSANTVSADAAEPAPIAPSKPTSQPIEPFHSGAPGRPTAIHIVITEGRRRIEEGEEIPTLHGLSKFAAELSAWFDQKRMEYDPPGPSVAAKTIGNSLRSFWNSKL
jgi:hypothetical protein